MAKKAAKHVKPATGWAIVKPSGNLIAWSVRHTKSACTKAWSPNNWFFWHGRGYTCQRVQISVVERAK